MGGADFFFAGLQPIHLGPNRRPVGGEEGQELPALLIVRCPEILIGKRLRQVLSAVKQKVHDEKGNVGDRIGEAEAVAEFDAVDDDWLLSGQQINVVEMQIAVSVARNAALGSGVDERPQLLDLLFRQGAQSLEDLRAEGRSDLRCGLIEVFPGVAGHDRESSEGTDVLG